jgi:hypothetical protein
VANRNGGVLRPFARSFRPSSLPAPSAVASRARRCRWYSTRTWVLYAVSSFFTERIFTLLGIYMVASPPNAASCVEPEARNNRTGFNADD